MEMELRVVDLWNDGAELGTIKYVSGELKFSPYKYTLPHYTKDLQDALNDLSGRELLANVGAGVEENIRINANGKITPITTTSTFGRYIGPEGGEIPYFLALQKKLDQRGIYTEMFVLTVGK